VALTKNVVSGGDAWGYEEKQSLCCRRGKVPRAAEGAQVRSCWNLWGWYPTSGWSLTRSVPAVDTRSRRQRAWRAVTSSRHARDTWPDQPLSWTARLDMTCERSAANLAHVASFATQSSSAPPGWRTLV
jgi:hypothetical protein